LNCIRGFPWRDFSKKNFSHTKNIFWIFPGTISPQTFPGNFPKNFSGTRDNPPVRVFSKNAASRLLRGFLHPNPHPMQPTLKNENEKTALPFIPRDLSPSGSRSPVQTVLKTVFFKPDLCRIQLNGQRIADFAQQPCRFFVNS